MSDMPAVLVQPIKAIKRARRLRKEMSLPEVLLWRELQKRPGGFKFRRQVAQHPYTLDFACLSARLAIEVDGQAHDRGDQPQKDGVRDEVMAERGFRTLRLLASDVFKDMESCVTGIVAACAAPNPPRNGEVAARSDDGGVPPFGIRGVEGDAEPFRPQAGALPLSGEDL